MFNYILIKTENGIKHTFAIYDAPFLFQTELLCGEYIQYNTNMT